MRICIDGVDADEVFKFNKQIITKYSTNNSLEVSRICQLLFVVGQITISKKKYSNFSIANANCKYVIYVSCLCERQMTSSIFEDIFKLNSNIKIYIIWHSCEIF